MDAADQGFEHLGVNGGADHPALATGAGRDGDDEVRFLAIAHENVADVDRVGHDPHEPLGVPVVAAGQLIRPHVGDVHAIGIENSQVRKGLGDLFQAFEYRLQVFRVAQLVEGVSVDDELDIAGALG